LAFGLEKEKKKTNTHTRRHTHTHKTKHSEYYEPESLKVMMTALDRHLKNKGYSLSIVHDKARQVSEEAKEIVWKSKKLGGLNTESVIQTMW